MECGDGEEAVSKPRTTGVPPAAGAASRRPVVRPPEYAPAGRRRSAGETPAVPGGFETASESPLFYIDALPLEDRKAATRRRRTPHPCTPSSYRIRAEFERRLQPCGSAYRPRSKTTNIA